MTARPVGRPLAVQTTSPSPATGLATATAYARNARNGDPLCQVRDGDPPVGSDCPNPAERAIVTACVHEHTDTDLACLTHVLDAYCGDLLCTPCAVGPEPHECEVRLVSDTPITAPAVSDKPATVSDT